MDGFRFSAVAAGIKKAGTTRLDLALIVSEEPTTVAAVTTTNLVFAAPVAITRDRVAKGVSRGVLINSGNANAYTGERGLQDALDLTRGVAEALAIDADLISPMSTGVIGNPLPLDRMREAIPALVAGLDPYRYMDVAHAMMTTDTRPKTLLLEGSASTGPFRILGMCKGSGMIAPNMATMLAVILTDIRVEASFLRDCLIDANEASFNSVTVDGDTSTNDTLIVLSGGRGDAIELSPGRSDREAFRSLLQQACSDLARQIALDGEGTTKVVEVRITGAPSNAAAAKIARTIAESPLVKTAFHGEDPNWGRIICAAGRAGVSFDPDRIDLYIGDVPIVKDGLLVEGDWESAAHKTMCAKEFAVLLDLKSGSSEARILTTDLSEEYVTINADYRS
ncbi:MAG: bifunctional glutamate N-acetyltransferase/amino-acid acetyltransferase ArgJ [Desulfomonile tiedjei]|nr:bifunctional glutamate N-acetyltransferase/amino-acid acetyltransferase ArgJ [Desulfomonile tiedjei]